MSPHDARLRLVADIGGTNARFAVVEPDGDIRAEAVLACTDHTDLVAAIRAYLDGLPQPHPELAALAVACPVAGDRVTFTNNERWSFSIAETRRVLGLERLLVLNDFTALALAVPHLPEAGRRWVGGGSALAQAAIGLIGPGTGLGVSGLVWSRGEWLPLRTEGGHASFSPIGELEWEIARVLAGRFGHVSFERLLSGPGLVNIYRALQEIEGTPAQPLEPVAITRRALSGEDSGCVRALEVFCAVLGTAAGNLALTLGALGGIYLGGGIIPTLGDFLDRSAFRERFEGKGRLAGYLSAIPTWIITAVHPALRGAAAALERRD